MCCSEVAHEVYSLVLDVKISEDERIQYIEFCKQILIDITIECGWMWHEHRCIALHNLWHAEGPPSSVVTSPLQAMNWSTLLVWFQHSSCNTWHTGWQQISILHWTVHDLISSQRCIGKKCPKICFIQYIAKTKGIKSWLMPCSWDCANKVLASSMPWLLRQQTSQTCRAWTPQTS